MAGGTIQLVMYGPEDVYFLGNPQITFFKAVYRRYTNFCIKTFEQEFPDSFNFGKTCKIKLNRLGDLITKMSLHITVPKFTPEYDAKFAWVRRLGHAIIKSVTVEIGGQTIDKQYGEWLDIWYELTRKGDHEKGYNELIGDVPRMTELSSNKKPQYDLYIPLQFWFNRHCGLALPMIAMQYHDIYVIVEFEKIEKLVVVNESFFNYHKLSELNILSASLLTDYVNLDIAEREKFAIMGHEYLIEQLQYSEQNVDKNLMKIKLSFTNPIKELIWGIKNGNYTSGTKFLCYTHEDDWENEIHRCSKKILRESMILLDNSENYYKGYEKVESKYISNNKKIIVINNSPCKSLWINTNSLKFGGNSLLDKIRANVEITPFNDVIIRNLKSDITEIDISIPVEFYEDNRVESNDIHVNQFCNYGNLITGKKNPVEYAKLSLNSQDRIQKRSGNFFNYLQPEMHHSSCPRDGINVYSFSLNPEDHQPSGTSNFSKIDKTTFWVWLSNLFKKFNEKSRLFIYATNYNVFKIMSGLSGLIY